MPRSTRFSVALHVLTHLVDAPEPQTSEQLAACVRTNPVVVRRTLAGLREAGVVTSSRGTGGGWALAGDPAEITLRDVYVALGERLFNAIDVAGPHPPRGGCRIQRAVAGTLDDFLDDAEALLAARLNRITLASLAARVRALEPRSHHSRSALSHAS
jgi:DNA-binding IscR family transcriptional regulator